MKKIICFITVAALALLAYIQWPEETPTSPNGKIGLSYDNGNEAFSITYDCDGNRREVMHLPTYGLRFTDDGDDRQHLIGWEKTGVIDEQYDMSTGKRRRCHNQANEYSYRFADEHGHEYKMVFRLYNDGVAFRYELPTSVGDDIPQEVTTYRIDEGTKRWMQRFNPSYEEFFPMTESGEGETRLWGYPALLQNDENVWTLISEAGIEKRHAASSLRNDQKANEYQVFINWFQTANDSEWHSPWRVLIIGSLADVVESTLITDVCEENKIGSTEWIRPGIVSWIYWAHNRGSKDFQIVKQYIDMAYDLSLPYVLIDWEWDIMGNGGTIEDALQYAAERNVRVLLWYNSSTAWTTNGAGGPLFKLNAPEDREREFTWLAEKGVAGVKIDFFSGDTQETMEYCIDLLESAARHHLLVNFHGATIPRGWQRTYPNLMSVEAVYGAEWYNNAPVLTHKAAAHNTTLPFTRNVIGPMDYTPCTFSDSQHPHITSHAHELALCVVFESALQHLADRPESYLAQPEKIKDFFSHLPSVWDETKLLSGYPGDHVIMARRKDNRWYVSGLNGTNQEKNLTPDWSFLGDGEYTFTWFRDNSDGTAPWDIEQCTGTAAALPQSIRCLARGGFTVVIEK